MYLIILFVRFPVHTLVVALRSTVDIACLHLLHLLALFGLDTLLRLIGLFARSRFLVCFSDCLDSLFAFGDFDNRFESWPGKSLLLQSLVEELLVENIIGTNTLQVLLQKVNVALLLNLQPLSQTLGDLLADHWSRRAGYRC